MAFHKKKNLSPWRKISLLTWKTAADPSVYGFYEFDTTKAQEFIDRLNKENPEIKITLTHFFAKCMAHVLEKYPAANGIIKWGTIYERDTIDLFLQVAIPHPDNDHREHLSGAKICRVNEKSMVEFAKELQTQAKDIRAHNDPQFKKVFTIANKLPLFLLKPLVRLQEFVVFNLGVQIPSLGLHQDPFGSAMLTSVGPLGTPPGFAPLVPPSRCPLLACLGRVEQKPWVVDGEIKIRPIAGFTFTFDHRFMDGLIGSRMFKALMHALHHPEDVF